MNRYRKKTAVAVGLLAALLVLLALITACSPWGNQTPGTNMPGDSPVPNDTTLPEGKVDLGVYYVKITADDAYLVRETRQVPYTREVARAALEELIRTAPVTPGASRVLPPETIIRGINIRDGLATVDFSREVLRANVGAAGESLGIQSIVNTLTEFPEIQKVSFLVEGRIDQEARDWWGHVGLYTQPFSRDISKVYEPVIWVTSPSPGQKVTSPVEVRGTARVFEATVSARLVDGAGNVLSRGYATATEGAPGRGEFVLSLPIAAASPGQGRVEVFWASPKDGSELDLVSVPVSW